ncbi:MAG: GNAT family N-acetyltransferase [Nanoarchaeota archaeon]|nr:GNAT family N-acetyltransferase [Nanoarchaeota archaeon]
MLFRNASIKDVNHCTQLAKQENESYWTKLDFFNCIQNTNAIFLVVEIDNNLVGYLTGFIVPTKNDEALIHELRIDLKYRGQKIGTKLVDKFCKEAFRKGAKTIYAMIEPKLKSFYIDSCKFKESGNWIEASRKFDEEK